MEFVEQPEVRELLALAQSETGDVVQAIAALETLIDTLGPTSERLGLLGGRYKRRLRSASETERLTWLNKSIDAYERGMDLDLNEYYCSSNLPRLYRTRKRKGDEERAQNLLKLVILACDRAKRRGVSDEWLRPTLLGRLRRRGRRQSWASSTTLLERAARTGSSTAFRTIWKQARAKSLMQGKGNGC